MRWKTLLVAALSFTVICIFVAAERGIFQSQNEPWRALIPLVKVDVETRVVGFEGRAVTRKRLEAPELKKCDLFSAYLANRRDEGARLTLAYLLIVQEEQRFLDFLARDDVDLDEELFLAAGSLDLYGLNNAYAGALADRIGEKKCTNALVSLAATLQRAGNPPEKVRALYVSAAKCGGPAALPAFRWLLTNSPEPEYVVQVEQMLKSGKADVQLGAISVALETLGSPEARDEWRGATTARRKSDVKHFAKLARVAIDEWRGARSSSRSFP